jgi:hypothetical protein
MISDERLKELAQRMAEAMGMGRQAKRPVLTVVQGGKKEVDQQSGGATILHLVKPAPGGPGVMDAVTRESHLRMIRTLRRAYRPFGVDLIVNQATLGKGSIEDLCDEELVRLHCDLEPAC